MKTLYIECNMGAAGDMLMGALSELIPDPDKFLREMNGLNIPGLHIERARTEKQGIWGTHMAVMIDGEEEVEPSAHDHHHLHHHSGLRDVEHIISDLPIPASVRDHALAVYRLIAEAEAQVHQTQVDLIHFHEVGALDAIADVVGVCWLMNIIKPERILVSPVHVGSGQVRCAHGILPVPAPATALLLKGVPIYGGQIRGELCTPTGAALLKHFADAFGDMPTMAVEKTGCGMGSKDFEWANCLRVMLGETADHGEVCELACNLDDMTGEAIAFACETLMNAGALDAWCESIIMKKGRPAVKLCCLCKVRDQETFAKLMLQHTTTLGVRVHALRRYTLTREPIELQSPWGPIPAKKSQGCGVTRVKPDYEALAHIARRENLSIETILHSLS